ncbi:iron-siderophore ABC transporter substrate-binding protein [Paroceanicella profunda]|uniref:Iron-siderophore ABC transporter substrate-binding protein n=1 Tax=Paroceanicella profunda TaxID=2579971 RepID=A0A5B8G434_9RHOB|nr:iron-siderophore ABC transporter substrate-binding protein [Paroceanicella profunda]
MGLLAGGIAAGPLRAGPAPQRVAVLDWSMLETLVALGQMPVAAAELVRFRETAVEPALDAEVIDLGLRGAPNFELMHLVGPDLILSSPYYARHRAALERIAPVMSLRVFQPGVPPLPPALDALDALGARLGRQAEARAARAAAEAEFDTLAARLARFADRPTYVVNIGDARHFRAFGFDSMFGNVLDRLGLPNAWASASRFSFSAPVPIEALAERPEARIVIVSDVPVAARQGLATSVLWAALEPVRAGRLSRLGNVNPHGGVCAARRFARLLAGALEAGAA